MPGPTHRPPLSVPRDPSPIVVLLRRLTLATAVAVSLAGCDADPPQPATPPNVVIVLIDTLRADRLGSYGNSRRLTPFLDQLAARGTVFRHAYAQSCWTNPSVASLFTSRFQTQHEVLTFASKLETAELTLAEALQGLGYATGAFVANGVLQANNGFSQGFEEFQAYWPQPGEGRRKMRGEEIGANALRWLDRLPGEPKRPVFLYLHYVEPHPPYSPPVLAIDRVRIALPRPDLDEVTKNMIFGNWTWPDASALRDIQDVYDAEVLSLDETLRDTFAALEARHLLDDAIVVVTADHGEEFLDHGHMGHGGTLYDELIHVPLLIHLSGQPAHGDIVETVALVDVAPTLLELAGVRPPASFEGRSLRTWLPGAPRRWQERLWPDRAHRPAFSELLMPPGNKRVVTAHQRAVVLEGRKLIVGPDGERERYDVVRDPTEEVLLDAGPDDAMLLEALQGLAARMAATAPAPPPTLSPELREHLRSLGYVE